MYLKILPGADKSLARPGRKRARKHVRDACDFNEIEMRAVIKFFFLQGKVPKEIHAILTETSAFFLPVRAKDLSAPLYILCNVCNVRYISVFKGVGTSLQNSATDDKRKSEMAKREGKALHFIEFNLLNSELNPICHLLGLLAAHHILHVSRIWVKVCHTEQQVILRQKVNRLHG